MEKVLIIPQVYRWGKVKSRETKAFLWSQIARKCSTDTLSLLLPHTEIPQVPLSPATQLLLWMKPWQNHTHSKRKDKWNVLPHIPAGPLKHWITGYFRTSPSSLVKRNVKFGNMPSESLFGWACWVMGLLGFGWKVLSQNQSPETH